jgi:hypothetical protein
LCRIGDGKGGAVMGAKFKLMVCKLITSAQVPQTGRMCAAAHRQVTCSFFNHFCRIPQWDAALMI